MTETTTMKKAFTKKALAYEFQGQELELNVGTELNVGKNFTFTLPDGTFLFVPSEYARTYFSISTNEVSELEFVLVADVLEAGQWVEWEVSFLIGDEIFSGFLQGCPNHPQDFHHDAIENCERMGYLGDKD